MRYWTKTLVCGLFGMVAAVGLGATDDASNLLPDPGFEKAKQQKPKEGMNSWNFYRIETPGEVSYTVASDDEPGSVTMKGGRSFLHSGVFDVQSGQDYTITCEYQGDGKLSAGVLWWKKYTKTAVAMTDPHWTKQEKASKASDEWQMLTATFTAPKEAKRAYVRFVVNEGEVTMRNVKVSEAE